MKGAAKLFSRFFSRNTTTLGLHRSLIKERLSSNQVLKQLVLLAGVHLTWKYASQNLNCEGEEKENNNASEAELKAQFEEEMKNRRVSSMKNLQRVRNIYE